MNSETSLRAEYPVAKRTQGISRTQGTSFGYGLFLLAILVSGSLRASAAYPTGYGNCKVVTTQHNMVAGTSDLVNYPLTVALTDPDLKTTANGGLVNSPLGYDIAFYSDCTALATPLKWEVESYSPVTGTLVAHVLRPSLSHTTDDIIGLFFGAGFTNFQSSAPAVWDANYKGVWHLANGTTLTAGDTTANANHGTPVNNPVAAAGKLDGAVALTASASQYINAGPIDLTGPITISVWAKLSSFPSSGNLMVLLADKYTNGAENVGRYLDLYNNVGTLQLRVGDYHASLTYGVAWNIIGWNAGEWHHVAGVYDGTAWKLYLDGLLRASANTALGASTNGNTFIGAQDMNGIPGRFLDGTLDEVRLSNTGRSADWILTEYRNQSSPSTYVSVGPRLSGSLRIRHSVRTDQ